jgi:hypothetical protein
MTTTFCLVCAWHHNKHFIFNHRLLILLDQKSSIWLINGYLPSIMQIANIQKYFVKDRNRCIKEPIISLTAQEGSNVTPLCR